MAPLSKPTAPSSLLTISSRMWVDLQGTFTPFAVKSGLMCLAAQCAVFLVLKWLGQNPTTAGPWSRRAGFTAHQVVCVPVLTYLTVEGLYLWIHESPAGTDEAYRLTGPNTHGHLSEFVLGMMAFWDIPTSALTKDLRKPAMIIHHILMFFTAAVALGLLSEGRPLLAYYAPFFFGAIELSSLPLLVVDLFHPKHKDWHQWLTRPNAPKWLSAVNEVGRVLFAVLFLLVRTAWFPYVSVMGVWRDVLRVVNPNPGDMLGLYVMGTFNACFSFLQMYWGTLVVKQIIKIFVPDDKTKAS